MIKWLEKNRKVSIIITIVIAIAIFVLSSLPGTFTELPIIKEETNIISIIYHLVIFFLFNFFLLISIKGKKKIKISYILLALIISVIYGISDEFHQLFVPFRYSTVSDVLTDIAGSLLSTLFLIYRSRKD